MLEIAKIPARGKAIRKPVRLKSRKERKLSEFARAKIRTAREIRKYSAKPYKLRGHTIGIHPMLRNALSELNKLPFCKTFDSNRPFLDKTPGEPFPAKSEAKKSGKPVYYRSPFIELDLDGSLQSKRFLAQLKKGVESIPDAVVRGAAEGKGLIWVEILSNISPEGVMGKWIDPKDIEAENANAKRVMQKIVAVCKRWQMGLKK